MAYIDPGSGSMVFQLLLASAIGSAIAFRKALGDLFRRLIRRRG